MGNKMAASKVGEVLKACCGCSSFYAVSVGTSFYGSRNYSFTTIGRFMKTSYGCITQQRSFLTSSILLRKRKLEPMRPKNYEKLKREFEAKLKAKEMQIPRDDVYILTSYKGFDSRLVHSLSDAIDVLKAFTLREEVETMRLNFNINMGSKETTVQSIDGTLFLPHTFGEAKKILVFAEDDLAEDAKAAGADFVGGEELFSQVEKEEIEFDHCLSSLDMLNNIKSLQKVLKIKFPNTRRGTATDDLVPMIKKLKYSQRYTSFRDGRFFDKNINVARLNIDFAKVSFPRDAIMENLKAVLTTVDSHRRDPDKTEVLKPKDLEQLPRFKLPVAKPE